LNLLLHAPIECLSGVHDQIVNTIEFVDVPGVNEASNPLVQPLIDRMLTSVDATIVLLNFQVLGQVDEDIVLHTNHTMNISSSHITCIAFS
jgi:hypothetical protein